VPASYQVQKGDSIHVCPLQTPSTNRDILVPAIEYLYEDLDILVLNKPAGMIVHLPGPEPILVSMLQELSVPLASGSGVDRPGIVHRLDRGTSGVIVIAKSDRAFEDLSAQFKDHTVRKTYIALAKGNIDEDEDIIDRPILKTSAMKKGCVHPTGKPSKTHIRVLKRYQTKTLLQISLITGRTHQIRIHLSSKGHPLLGDSLYGAGAKNRTWPLLQAYHLGFKHPGSHVSLNFKIPIKKEFNYDPFVLDSMS